MPQPFQTLLGVLLAAVVAYAAYRMRSLNLSGGLAAFLLGSIVFGLGGLPWAVLLLLFFITSTGLSFQLKKKNTGGDQYAKGSQRDAWQVGANGGIAGVMVILHGLHPTSPLPWALFAAALAAANADTWATEVGAMSESWPRKITTLKPVPPGTSGGVSAVGTLAAAAGSLVIALGAVYLWPHSVDGKTDGWGYAAIIFLAGFLGSLLDSLLGATVQQIYWCPNCEKETEKSPVHSCGSPTVRLRGWRWLNNDVINLACTLSATVTALILTRIV